MINKEELLIVVDANNNQIGIKPRKEVHQNGLWHRTSHVWIINNNKQLLCQRRSLLKDKNPGKWESFFGGHLGPEVEYLDGAITEIQEELGLKLSTTDLVFWKIFKHEEAKEFQGVYIYKWNGEAETLIFEKDEIDQIKWLSLDDVKDSVLNKKLDTWTYIGYEPKLLQDLEKLT